MAVSVKLMSDNTRQAREMALDGDYDSACIFYSGVLQQVQKILSSSGDPGAQSRWTMVSGFTITIQKWFYMSSCYFSDPKPDKERV